MLFCIVTADALDAQQSASTILTCIESQRNFGKYVRLCNVHISPDSKVHEAYMGLPRANRTWRHQAITWTNVD